MQHLINVRKRIVRCVTCGQRIWFAYDGGMPIYAELDTADLTTEIRARLSGLMSFVEIGSYLAMRNTSNVSDHSAVHIAHPHRAGFDEIEDDREQELCLITTNSKAIDFSVPF